MRCREEGLLTLLLLCLPVVVHKLMYYVCLADAQLLADLLDRVGIFPSEPECPVYQIKASVLAPGSLSCSSSAALAYHMVLIIID